MNTQLTATVFLSRDAKAQPVLDFSGQLVGDETNPPFFDRLKEFIDNAADNGADGFGLTLSAYTGAHDLQGWQAAHAVSIEYESSDRQRVNRALDGMGVAHAYIETRGGHFAVVIPVSEPIQTSSAYTRIAALIEQDIGVSGATTGSAICTFVFKPARRAKIEVITGVILDAEDYRLSANAAGRKTFAKDYEGAKSSILRSMPPLRAFTPQLTPLRATWDGSDLFSF